MILRWTEQNIHVSRFQYKKFSGYKSLTCTLQLLTENIYSKMSFGYSLLLTDIVDKATGSVWTFTVLFFVAIESCTIGYVSDKKIHNFLWKVLRAFCLEHGAKDITCTSKLCKVLTKDPFRISLQTLFSYCFNKIYSSIKNKVYGKFYYQHTTLIWS